MRVLQASIRAAASAAAFFVPAAALAGGYYVPDSGTVARARGGAFCAAANDPLAMRYNPAGLADLRRAQLLVDVTTLWLDEKFARDPASIPADSVAGTKADSNPPPQFVPALIYVQPIGSKLTLAAGLHAPAGPRFKFKKDGPQRFTNETLYNTEAAYGIAVAYRFHRIVSAGISFEGVLAGVLQDFVIERQGENNPPTEDPQFDAPQTLDVEDPFSPSATLGLKITPIETIEIGFSYRPPIKVNAPGTLHDEFSNSTEKVHFRFTLPSILRLGARYVQPRWDAEADFVIEDWSSHDEEVLTPDDGNFLLSTRASQVREFGAAYSLRVGGSYALAVPVRLHGGVFYETSAVPKNRMDVGTIDSAKTALNLGVSWDAMERLTVSGNYSHCFLQPVTVTNSKVRQQSPYGPIKPENELSIISNGKYTAAYDFFGLALLAKF